MEDITDVRFSAHDATRAHGDHVVREYHGYSKFASACKARLRRFSLEHPTQTFLIYSVPMVIAGAALRDARAVINHIIHTLKRDGFDAQYLGSNLIFIQWKRAEDQEKYVVNDYVEDALRGGSAPGGVGSTAMGPVVVPPTRAAIARRGPGQPTIIMSDGERHKARMDQDIAARMQNYERDVRHPNAVRRKMFDNHMSHEDAMRAVTARSVL